MEIKEQVDAARTSRTSKDKKASPNDTLKAYKAKYPDQAEDLETMLERLQALKNFVDKNLNDLEDYAKLAKTIEGLFCIHPCSVTRAIRIIHSIYLICKTAFPRNFVAMDILQRNSQKALATWPSTTPTRIFWDKTVSFLF